LVVKLIEVDGVDPQTLEAAIEGRQQVLRGEAGRWIIPFGWRELRRDHDRASVGLMKVADQLLRDALAIGIGRAEAVDASMR
jgi:hypothetical protein